MGLVGRFSRSLTLTDGELAMKTKTDETPRRSRKK